MYYNIKINLIRKLNRISTWYSHLLLVELNVCSIELYKLIILSFVIWYNSFSTICHKLSFVSGCCCATLRFSIFQTFSICDKSGDWGGHDWSIQIAFASRKALVDAERWHGARHVEKLKRDEYIEGKASEIIRWYSFESKIIRKLSPIIAP